MNEGMRKERHLYVCAALWLLVGAAQAEPDPSPAKVEQITVTATRREMNLQDVTGTIDAVSASKLDALQINDAQGVEKVVPGVAVARSGGITPFIRGIGTFNAGHSEASAGFYLDGIYIPNSAGVRSLSTISSVSRS